MFIAYMTMIVIIYGDEDTPPTILARCRFAFFNPHMELSQTRYVYRFKMKKAQTKYFNNQYQELTLVKRTSPNWMEKQLPNTQNRKVPIRKKEIDYYEEKKNQFIVPNKN